MASAGGGPIDIVVCEKHGLRYNRAAESGCVRCRRESAAAPAPTGARPAASSRAAGPLPAALPAAPPERPASALLQLLLAACLVVGTGTLLWTAHEAVLATFGGGLLGAAGKAGAATVPGNRPLGESPWPGGAGEPSPSPRSVTVGPAEEQRQMDELMRQLKQDQQREQQQLEQQRQTGELSPQ
jgi:hypothetical protein